MKGKELLKSLKLCKCSNGIVKIGDKVKIEGDVQLTKNIVNVPYDMAPLINNNKIYEVEEIKESVKGPPIIKVCGWWWDAENIRKLSTEKIKPTKPQLFQIEQLDI